MSARLETGEQIQQIMDLLPDDWNTSHYDSLMFWLDGQYLTDAYPEWKTLSRYEQADWYITWLKEESRGRT
jgi:hypothetical protein